MKTFNLDPKVCWCYYYWCYQVCSDNKEKLISDKKEDGTESKEPDYDEDKDQLEEKQEEETGEKATMNTIFWFNNRISLCMITRSCFRSSQSRILQSFTAYKHIGVCIMLDKIWLVSIQGH